MKAANIAIFDLDYTLTQRGTWGRFVIQCVKYRPHLWLPVLLDAGVKQWLYTRGKRPRIAVKTAMMRWVMVGKPRAELLAAADAFAAKTIETGLRPGAVQALERHRAAGDTVIIASAAVDLIVEAMARRLGIEHWVATDMDWDDQDRLRPVFKSENCYGSEKLSRVKALLALNPGLKHNHTNITIYSDSYSDLDILSWGDVGVAVNPDRRLRAAAPNLGFQIVDWT